MTKLIALGSTIAWSAFWVFGGLALLSPAHSMAVIPSALIAFIGMAVGSYCFLWLRTRSWDELLLAKR